MNALLIAIFALTIFFLAYKFYAKRLERLWSIDPKRSTPAYSKYDSVDYIPARNWLVLFGHHFSSIAGAGPIVGPVIAVMLWGWLPALLWIILGTIFIGGLHDFGALITSVREGGSSIAQISDRLIGRPVRLIFSLFIWLALILVIAVFVYLCAETFIKEPKIVLPSLGLIPLALVVGYLLYSLRANSILVTLFGVTSLAGLIFFGNSLPIALNNITLWILILLAYSYLASILPVNILLQPRDYLSSFLLFLGVGVGYLGLFFSQPKITMPYYQGYSSPEGYLWPALFVTIACGAISGFHALIASGTSSKQLANERDAKKIGYGGMLAEGLVAVLAIVAVAILFKGGEDFSASLKDSGPVGIFGKGYGLITHRILGIHGRFIAITILNAFILTTLDTATRISRYITEELFAIRNRHLSTVLVITSSGALALTGKWQKIWPVFGAANQLIAALTLLIIIRWLLSHKKSIRLILPVAIFMLITTTTALGFKIYQFFKSRDYFLLTVSSLLAILTLLMVMGSTRRKGKEDG